MKKSETREKLMKLAILFIIVGFISTTALAQPGKGKRFRDHAKDHPRGFCLDLPDMSEEQVGKLKEMQTAFMKEMLPLKNEMDVKRAELKAISTGDDVDMKEVNKKIDEISVLKASMMKKHAAHRQAVREVLNEEQKVIFDQRGPGHGKGHGKGYGKGRAFRGQGPRGPHGFGGLYPDCPRLNQEDIKDM